MGASSAFSYKKAIIIDKLGSGTSGEVFLVKIKS